MTSDTTPGLSPDSFEQRLQAATTVALEALVAIASNLSEPGHARLAAAEILRFAARHKPGPSPRPRREGDRALSTRPFASSLGAVLNLLGDFPQPGPAKAVTDTESPDRISEAPAPAEPPGCHGSPRSAAAQQCDRAGSAGPPESCSNPEDSRRSPELSSPHPRLDPYARISARKRKRARQRAARAGTVSRST